jgi:hypothetical protein
LTPDLPATRDPGPADEAAREPARGCVRRLHGTEIRARGGGAATSASRAGGVLIILKGIETRQRSLETITRGELRAESAAIR